MDAVAEAQVVALALHVEAVGVLELSLVPIAGLVWMCITGAYLVLLSFAPVFLHENGISFATAGRVVSLMSWVFLFSLPLGGFLATRLRAPNIVMFTGLAGTVLVCGVIR